MSEGRKRIAIAAIWGLGLIPAALLTMWFGYADWSWAGFAKAWGALLALMLVYELFEWWVARLRARRRSRHTAQPTE